MARLRYNALLENWKGAVGDLVLKKRGNTPYLSRRPDFSKRKLSAKQELNCKRFKEAVVRAKAINADPVARAHYEAIARSQKKEVFRVIMSECARNTGQEL
jgi:hypothetical protein